MDDDASVALTVPLALLSHLKRVICSTCGRDNPGHLLFCQECGQRLAPRVAPPTPPVGLPPAGSMAVAPTSPLAATASMAPGIPTPPPTRPSLAPPQRPPAPEVNFASRGEAVVPADQVICPLCGSTSQRGLRFCVSCGHLLAQSAVPGAGRSGTIDLAHARPSADHEPMARAPSARPPAPIASVHPAPTFTSAASAAPIAPMRVVDIGGSPPVVQRPCPRCRGTSEPGAQFCRFCGAALTEASAVPAPMVAAVRASRPPPPPGLPSLVGAPPPAPPTQPAQLFAPAAGIAPAAHALPLPSASSLPPTPRAPSLAPRLAALASSSAPAGVRLVLVARDGGEGPSYPLAESTDLGRIEGQIIIADDRYVSPRHARIAWRGGAFFLRDLGSTNGIFLRIPFLTGEGGDPNGDGGGGSLVPRASLSPEGPGAAIVGNSEQALTDQDLFLVGQQVLRFEVVKHAEEGFGVASENGTLLFGTPAAPRYARLSQRTVEGVVRDVFHLRKSETVIGRESGDIVFTDDPFLSRRHSVVRVYGAGAGATAATGPRRYAIADLGSSNGTFLQIREEVRLRHKDQFRIGQQLFRFDMDAARAGA